MYNNIVALPVYIKETTAMPVAIAILGHHVIMCVWVKYM